MPRLRPRTRPGVSSARSSLPIAGIALALACLCSFFLAAPGVASGDDASSGPDAVWFPPTPAGWPGEERDPRDVAPYLAFHKAALRHLAKASREEPLPTQALYDARYYDLQLDLNPTTRILTGTVTGRFTVTAGPLTSLDLDLANNMAVSAVTCNGAPAAWSHLNRILTVQLDRSYATGEDVTLVISYAGNPAGDAFGWDSAEGQPMIWTLSEAFGARSWWPCKDYPDDKADSVDVRVTVPSGLIVASNGRLRQQSDNGISASFWWHEGHPITTYLVSLCIHNYHLYSDTYVSAQGDSMEIEFYNWNSSIPDVMPVQAKVKEMIGAFAARYGEYPFLDEKYGHAEFPWGGGMEHQTCTSLGYFSEAIEAHELAHQWWGDMVTCATFHDIWLNEGFATYSEALWWESQSGWEGYIGDLLLNQYFGPGTIYVPDTSDWGRIFDSNLSYNKASWVVHMLRGVCGDSLFFAGLAEFRDRFAYDSATTADLEQTFEDVTGLDLSPFFQQWIYGEYYPVYKYDWSAEPAGGGWDVHLTVRQMQTWQLFAMPIEVVVETAGGPRPFRVESSAAQESYVLRVDAEPTGVSLDPNRWILRQVIAPIPTPAFDRQILLVNGVDWATYDAEIRSAYEDRAFTGDYAVDFWDTFDPPAGGYPSVLPAPLGHGPVPGDVIGHYEAVVWIGNNYGGDLDAWSNSPIYSYLEAGGTVFLLSRMGEQFIQDPLRGYLGIDWIGTGTIYDCIATHAGLSNIARIGTQSLVSGFSMTGLGPETTLLYKAVQGHTNPNWGIGAIRVPAGGGTYNPDGGRFAFLSGRPYRWNHANLRTNCEYILGTLLGLGPASGVEASARDVALTLRAGAPNPFRAGTTIAFTLPEPSRTSLSVFDPSGRRVRVLCDRRLEAGAHQIAWNGEDDAGRAVPSGVYFVRLESPRGRRVERLLRVR